MNRLTAGLLATGAMFAVASSASAAEVAQSAATKAINELIAKGWADQGIKKPAAKCSDAEFLRRAFIDLIGRIATPDEVLDFEGDKAPDKRAKLIKRLLNDKDFKPKPFGAVVKLDKTAKKSDVLSFDYHDEFAQHWANIWSVWLMTRSGHPLYRDQMNLWLWKQFNENVNHKEFTVRLITATGKSDENGAVNFILHHMGEPNPEEKRRDFGPFDAVPITSRVTKLFLGLQTHCTQCHDHPFNKEWVQADFWGVNAYFRQTTRNRNPTPGNAAANGMMANPVQVELRDDAGLNGRSTVFYERRDGKLEATRPAFLKDVAVAMKELEDQKRELSIKTPGAATNASGKSRRQILADYVVTHDNFANAYVNRIWGHLFGRGLNTEPSFDDFGSNNEILHPELMKVLAEEFKKYNYDTKQLLEWICTSDVYSLSHEANPAYIDQKYNPYFARMPLKAMSPEVLFESLMVATKAEVAADADARRALRDRWMAKLVRNFGDDEGNEVTFNGTVIQALLMLNGSELNSEITRSAGNVVDGIVKKHSVGGKAPNVGAILDDLFIAALNRRPTSHEKMTLINFQQRGKVAQLESEPAAPVKPVKPVKPNPKDKKPAPTPQPTTNADPAGPKTVVIPPAAPNDLTFYQDVFWALLNTNEFMLNH